MARCLCVGAAPSDANAVAWVLETQCFDAIYAVDGGYATLQSLGVEPTEVFGDFDSLGYVPTGASAAFDWHKDFTDMDWALQHARGQGFDDVFMLQALEGRLDHSVANLQLLAKYARLGLRVWGLSPDQVVVCLVGGGPLAELVFLPAAQGTFSLLSHSDACEGVIEEGLEWELGGARFSNADVLGISNEFRGKSVRVSIGVGSAWAFFPYDALACASWGASPGVLQ